MRSLIVAFAVAAACLASLPVSFAAGDEPPAGAQADEFGDTSSVEVVQGGAIKEETMSLLDIAEHLHSAVVHFPIAWLFLLLVAELWSVRYPLPQGVLLGLAVITAVAFIPAIATGLLNLRESDPGDEKLALVLQHRNLMFGAFMWSSISLLTRVPRVAQRLGGSARVVRWASLLAANALVMWGGHLGGRIVFGDDFLPF